MLMYHLVRIAQIISGDQVDIPKTSFNSGPDGTFQNALNIFLGICGAIAVFMIGIGGFKYTMSMGEPSATKKAKDTILYAIIGLLIVLISGSIVNFVLVRL